MIACDFDLNITTISCGWEGSATDARVLSSVILKGFKVPEGKFYLVDGGYANTQNFLAPYRRVRYHLKEFGHGYDDQHDNIDPADYVNLPNGDDNHVEYNEQDNYILGNNLRDQIAMQMWNDYQLE
jgi:hypothetical protein